LLTSNIGYVRLHGRNPANALGAYGRVAPGGSAQYGARLKQHDYLYSDAELAAWTKRIEHISRFAERTFVVFNNDAGGKSFVNALQLQAEMTGMRGGAPRDLRRKYPVELSRF